MQRYLPSWRAGAALLVVLAIIAGAAAWWFGRAPAPPKDALAGLKERGFITIGVRAHAPPFSLLGNDNAFTGYEPDIGRSLATALGVQAKFIAIDAQSANKFLERTLIDVAILPREGADARDAAVRTLEPGYFASGLNAISLSTHPLGAWEELKGAAVCGLGRGAPAERMVKELGGHYIGFPDVTTGLQALAAERCMAFVNDEVALAATMAGDVDHQYSMTLETMDPAPWGVAVRTADKALADRIAAQLATWHRTGFLIERAAAWKVPPSPYLASMRTYYADR